MKKKILLLLFIFLSIIHAVGQIQKSDLSKMNINGYVKMLVERKYSAKEKFGIFQKINYMTAPFIISIRVVF